MSVLLSDEQVQFAETLRSVFDNVLPTQRVIDLVEGCEQRELADVWQLLVEVGVTSVGCRPDGLLMDLGVAVEIAGSALMTGAVLAHGLAVRMIGLADDSGAIGARVWSEALTSGEMRASAAADVTGGVLRLEGDGEGWRAYGTLHRVLEAPSCDLIVAWSDLATNPAVVVLRLDAEGVSVTPSTSFDPSRSWSDVVVEGAIMSDADVIRVDTDLPADVAHDGAVLVAFDSLGSAERALEDAVSYAKVREQFGQPIGSFQAVKHILVDSHLTVDAMRSAVIYAAWSIDEHQGGVDFAVHAAKALSEGQRTVASNAIQVLGGIGFTREMTAHLHLKRSVLNERMFGTPASHRAGALATVDAVRSLWSSEESHRLDLPES
jgi:alkylation response protein AidB-like acyl-CoA dehydrogenase